MQSPLQLDLATRGLKAVCQAQRLADARDLKQALSGRRWITKKHLCASLNWSVQRIMDAKLAARGHVISSSQRGYCLASEATHDEFLEALNEQQHRYKTLQQTYMDMHKVFHSHHPIGAPDSARASSLVSPASPASVPSVPSVP